MVKRRVHKFTAYCPFNDVCNRTKSLGTFYTIESAKRSIRDHLVNSSYHYIESASAMDLVTSECQIDPWTDEEESEDLRGHPHSYEKKKQSQQKPLALRPRSQAASASVAGKRARSPSKSPSRASASSAGAVDHTDVLAAAVANAVVVAMKTSTAASKAPSVPTLQHDTAYPSFQIMRSSAASGADGSAAWTKAVNTIVRTEAAAKKAAEFAKLAHDSFNEVAFTLKQQIDVLESLGYYQPPKPASQ